MLTSFIVFLRAVGLYLLFTLPTIAFPPMYLLSAFLAISFGSVACFLFMWCYLFLSKSRMNYRGKWNILIAVIPVAVAAGYLAMGLFDIQGELWGFNLFMVFPGIGLIAGWASLFISRKKIREELDPERDETELLLKP
jgi:hypothetical protein